MDSTHSRAPECHSPPCGAHPPATSISGHTSPRDRTKSSRLHDICTERIKQHQSQANYRHATTMATENRSGKEAPSRILKNRSRSGELATSTRPTSRINDTNGNVTARDT